MGTATRSPDRESTRERAAVRYSTADGTATAGTDYTAENGTLTLASGVTSLPVAVAIIGDVVPERDETFRVRLSRPGNATLGVVAGTGTMQNDDDTPS